MKLKTTAILTLTAIAIPLLASDHGDAPLVSNDQGTDLGDVYLFPDPNDANQLVMVMTTRGFLVPGEAGNLAFFQSGMTYRFGIENTGDAIEDASIAITFDERTAAFSDQTATITATGVANEGTFTAQTTAPSLDAVAPAFVTTNDVTTGITFFAGVVDDPFFFDVVGLGRFLSGGMAADLMRGRDTFAGYNTMAIALSIPIADVMGTGPAVGVSAYTELPQRTKRSRALGIRDKGIGVAVDRAGTPAVNTLLVPFARKDEYNRASTEDDAAGAFAGDIVAALTSLGTNQTNIDLLASIAVTNGDYLRFDPGSAVAFPNGRALSDDVVDTLLTVVMNGTPTGDSVNANDQTFGATFPFLAPPNQPFTAGTADDGTRN